MLLPAFRFVHLDFIIPTITIINIIIIIPTVVALKGRRDGLPIFVCL